MELEVIEYLINESEDANGVYAISLVSEPAIESSFVQLSEHKIEMKLVDEARGVLMGAALIPDKEIMRKGQNGNPDYKIWFSKDTIRKTSELYMQNSHHQDSTLEHKIDLNGNTVVETWIKEDEVNDKSVLFGLDAPVGSWIITMKIHDPKILQLAKDGKITGFSIEGMFDDEQSLEAKLLSEITEMINNL